MPTTQIEQQLTILLRRVQSIHLSTSSGGLELDRSAYGIMCRLADEGPQRLSALAHAFGLDPSTITRQVQALEQAQLVSREPDPHDRRASVLSLNEYGHETLDTTRKYRRDRLAATLDDWSAEEQRVFGQLLEKFNASMDRLVSQDEPAS